MKIRVLFLLALVVTNLNIRLHAQGTAFTYQGQLSAGGSPANAFYDLTFALYNASTGGAQVGTTVTNLATGVTNGLFTVTLDFGPTPYNGQPLWLQIAVSPSGSNSYTTLSPLQPLTSTPYAVQSLNAGTAGNVTGPIALSQLPGVVLTNSATNVNLTGTFSGNGGGLTNLNASKLAGGTIPLAVQNPLVVTNNASGVNLAGTFSGDGTGLTLGQSGSSVYGTSSLTISAATGFTLIPGLTQTIIVPLTSSVIYISTSGGVGTTSGSTSGFSAVNIAVFIDGVAVTSGGGYQRVLALNNAGFTEAIQNWSMSLTTTLTAGEMHTIAVGAEGAGTGSSATVSGNNTSALQGALSVLILRQ